MQPKDYDSTLVRVAGNIAAGLVGARPTEFDSQVQAGDDATCDRAMAIAQGIIARGRRLQADRIQTDIGRQIEGDDMAAMLTEIANQFNRPENLPKVLEIIMTAIRDSHGLGAPVQAAEVYKSLRLASFNIVRHHAR